MKISPKDDDAFNLFLKRFGQNVKEIRRTKHRTQEWMDDKQEYGIDIKHFQSIEQGRSNITLKTVFKICRKLQVEPSDLFTGIRLK